MILITSENSNYGYNEEAVEINNMFINGFFSEIYNLFCCCNNKAPNYNSEYNKLNSIDTIGECIELSCEQSNLNEESNDEYISKLENSRKQIEEFMKSIEIKPSLSLEAKNIIEEIFQKNNEPKLIRCIQVDYRNFNNSTKSRYEIAEQFNKHPKLVEEVQKKQNEEYLDDTEDS